MCIKRPITYLALGLLIGEVLYIKNINIKGIIISIFFILLLATFSKKVAFLRGNKSFIRFMFLAFCFVLAGYVNLQIWENRMVSDVKKISNGSSAEISGEIYDKDISDKCTKLFVKSGKSKYVLLDYEGICRKNVVPGKLIRARGSFKDFNEVRNEGGFDEEKYYKSLGISGKIELEEIEKTELKKGDLKGKLTSELYALKINLKERLIKLAGKKYGNIYAGILLGEKGDIDEDVTEIYQLAGISHILSISGLHVSIIGFFVYKLFRKRHGIISSGLLSILVIYLYDLLIFGGYSTNRAVIMIIICIGADICGRTYDILSALSISMLLTLIFSPAAVENTGFMLSYLAIIGINPVGEIAVNFAACKSKFIQSLLVSSCITMTTLMTIIESYNQITVYSVFVNLIIIPLMSFVVAFGMGGLIFSYIWFKGGKFVIAIGVKILRFYNFICKKTVSLKHSLIIVGDRTEREKIIYVTFLIIFFTGIYLWRKKRKSKEGLKNTVIRLVIFGLFFIINTGIFIKNHDDEIFVKAIDVGQGDSIFIKEHSMNILIDAGSTSKNEIIKYTIYPFLKANGVNQIDYLIMTHSDIDHAGGMAELLDKKIGGKNYVKNLIVPDVGQDIRDETYEKVVAEAKKHGINVIYFSKGMCIKNNKTGWDYQCLWPEQGNNVLDKNTQSMVIRMENKKYSLLFVGDLSSEGEEALLEEDSGELKLTDIDVLKVGHHGSSTSSSDEFLKVINPELALISCGVNNSYGHPHQAALERLKNAGCEILRTDRQGEIILKIGKKIKTEILKYS